VGNFSPLRFKNRPARKAGCARGTKTCIYTYGERKREEKYDGNLVELKGERPPSIQEKGKVVVDYWYNDRGTCVIKSLGSFLRS